MKKNLYLLLLSLFIISCNDAKWWSDRLISNIEWNNGVIETFEYNDEGRLIHYAQKYIAIMSDSTDSSEIYYDVNIEYLGDTVVKMKGVIPYKTTEERGYSDGEITYWLNKDGLAISAITHYDDSSLEEGFAPKTRFEYRNSQLTYVSGIAGGKSIGYENNNIEYKHNTSSGFMLVSTFIYYYEKKNKSCLPGALDRFIGYHIPAYYARLLGSPSKNLVSKNATIEDGIQLVSDYSYEFDEEGYVTDMSIRQSSNVQLFGRDMMASSLKYWISYK